MQKQPGTGSNAGLAGAVADLTAQVSIFVGAMSEEKSASTIKWDRKRPVIKASDAESLMIELVELENLYAELSCKTFKKKWSVFRPSFARQGQG